MFYRLKLIFFIYFRPSDVLTNCYFGTEFFFQKPNYQKLNYERRWVVAEKNQLLPLKFDLHVSLRFCHSRCSSLFIKIVILSMCIYGELPYKADENIYRVWWSELVEWNLCWIFREIYWRKFLKNYGFLWVNLVNPLVFLLSSCTIAANWWKCNSNKLFLSLLNLALVLDDDVLYSVSRPLFLPGVWSNVKVTGEFS